MSCTSMGMDTFPCGAVTGLCVRLHVPTYAWFKEWLTKGKADALGRCDSEKREAKWFSCWKERQVCVQSQALSTSVLLIFRDAVNLQRYLRFEHTCSLWPHRFLFTGVSWSKHKRAMTCLRVLLTLQYIHTEEELLYLLSFKEFFL